MDADLAKELREATNQLLDLGPLQSSTFPTSPHLQQRPNTSPARVARASPAKVPTFSADSKLEVLHSPTDVRPWQWPAPSAPSPAGEGEDSPSVAAAGKADQPIKIELGKSVLDDADDRLPARGLSSRIGSVKAGTSDMIDITDHLEAGIMADGDDELRAPSPGKLRIRTPVHDIYINQYGERVVGGKVVGRTLGGRPRPASRDEDAPHPGSGISLDRPSSPSLTTSPHRASLHPDALASSPAKSATSPPAFFLESFPDAFSPPPTAASPKSSLGKNKERKERRTSRGGGPSILKAPRAVAGALTLAHSDNIDDPVPVLPRDTSFKTASDFGSPSSSSSKQLSPRPRSARILSSSSSRKDVQKDIDTALHGLRLQGVDAPGSGGLLSPSDGMSTTSDGVRGKLELPGLRRPTPTIELSQAKAEPVVLHGNRRQARASGVALPDTDASSVGTSNKATPDVSPQASFSSALPSPQASLTQKADLIDPAPAPETDGEEENRSQPEADSEQDPYDASNQVRIGSASEPSSPLMSPRRSRHTNALDEAEAEAGANDDDEDDDDKASLESAPSSLISLPVSTLTTSSRSPSHTSPERRRSNSSTYSSPSLRRRSSSRAPPSDVFAREVRIRGWSEVGSQARGWVVFELRIITKQGTPISAHKRFSSFVKLRSTLKAECKEQANWLPELPTRRAGLLSKYDARYLEKRRRALQRWLEVVALDRVWGSSEGLREWVLASD